MPRYRIEFSGDIRKVKREYGSRGARELKRRVGLVIEEGTRDMAEQAYQYAPKDTTALAQSIIASVEREAPLTWYFGSTMPYAQRQEYEHKTKSAYFRRAIWKETPFVYDRLTTVVKDQFKG